MNHKILSIVGLFYGEVKMPKKFEINRKQLSKDILRSVPKNFDFPFSKTWDKLDTYIREHINLKFNLKMFNKGTFGYIFKPKERSIPFLDVDLFDLKSSPDFTMLYGVDIKENCIITIFYDDNRKKGKSWDVKLENNKFVMFPSTNRYVITNNQKKGSNLILKINYEYI